MVGEPAGTPDVYGDDRVFVQLVRDDSEPPAFTAFHPLIRIRVEQIEPLRDEYQAKGVVHSELAAKPWGSKDFGVFDLNGAALVFYEDL